LTAERDSESRWAKEYLNCAERAEKELLTIYALATRLTAEVTVEWSGMARSLCDAINASAAHAAAEEER
jgi:hypothetical protein